jgi:NADPH:quinone reductase-like Zn-dependent oxidoreductase
MKAINVLEKDKVGVVEREEPAMRPDYVKVKAVACCLNPTDTFGVFVNPSINHMLGERVQGIGAHMVSDLICRG